MKIFQIPGKILSKGFMPLRKFLKAISGQKTIIICPKCNAIYFEKSWKHLTDDLKKILKENSRKIINKLCPADQMIEKRGFEGEIVIKNPPTDPNRKQELFNIIKNISQKAYKLDPLDRLISIEDKNHLLRVLLTDNNLALSMGRQIVHAFKGNFKVRFSRLRKLAHVEITLS